jgi:succinyl-CoA synthetase beta subunit
MAGKRNTMYLIAVISIVLLVFASFSGCKKSLSEGDLIVIDISQSRWSMDYVNSAGTIEIVLQGAGVQNIILDSIRMRGDNPSAEPLEADSAHFEGGRVVALFAKNKVMLLLLNPSAGRTYTISVTFSKTDSADPVEVNTVVTITNESSEFTLEIDPDEWNLNYTKSSGTVEAFIEGEGIDNIDLDSIQMQGDNDEAAPLAANSASMRGSQIHARFPKNQVIGLLSDPEKGSTHTIIISFMVEGGTERLEFTAEITIEDDDDIIDPSELELEIDPEEWNLNFTNSSGTVEAFIKGEDIDKIDMDSIQMQGDNTEADPLAAQSASLNGDHIHARFPKNQVIGLLLDPEEGSIHTIIISFLVEGSSERLELTAEITIEDDDDIIDPSDLELEIEPDEWNLNFTKSSGTVEAFIEGEGIDKIDLDSIQMQGDNPGAEPLAANSASMRGSQIHARFPKNQVIGLLLDPEEGSTHTIIISFLVEGGTERLELTAEITIEDDDDDIEPSDLGLEIVPPQWNMNYSGSSGNVKAFIRGEGIENIDLDSIEMEGDNPGESLEANSAKLSGNHVKATFPKNQVLDLLSDPGPGTTHTITVSFVQEGGSERLELTTEISITN